ncbi:hypothetical protein [Paraflavitalea speifideaquila]|uniref:hypothetical protein n=1 Tax=Paraflavitalea speifideaquila TaxID=3076558 RepID=UPI0028EBFA5F|nr:hypothetical protein [Paraflavitalea speifideiaquila]
MKRNSIYYVSVVLTMLMFRAVHAQDLVVNAFIPPGALIQKEQLWNVVISNPSSAVRTCQISLTILNKANGNKMLTALTNNIVVPGGARQIQVADVMPVVYNALHEQVTLGGQGLLPVGHYQVCYELVSNKGASYGSTCIDVQVDVLAPPQLIFPENKSELQEQQPAFSWMPPAPMALVRNCTYEYTLVKVNNNQTAADAIRDNAPVYRVGRLTNIAFTYPASAMALEKKQLYAWQITAQAATNIKSDVWTFSVADKVPPKGTPGDGLAYTKLARKNEQVSYSIVAQGLKFSWYNESLDSLFQIRVVDVTGGDHIPVSINEESIPVFSPGINIVEIDLAKAGKFIRDHLYEFSLIDKQGQEWKMSFEYKGKKK